MPKDNGKGSKRASKRRRSSEAADTAVVEAAAPAPKKPATGKASAEPSHSSEDVTTVVASTSRGHKLETLAEAEVEVPGSDDALDAEDVPDDADELILEAADNSSGSGEDDDEEEDEDEEMLDDELGDVDDDDVSYDSQIEGDVQTNVDGAEGPAADRETLVRLKGVKFFDDDEVTNAARSNMNRLLRNRRYHDDDVSESIVRHAVGPRCFKCGFPGHVAARCPAPPQQPCNLCAGFGHAEKDQQCPKDVRTCVRCGQQSCKAGCQGDWYRFMEGCNRQYSKSDKKHVRCFVCGKTGHFCCKTTPEEPVEPTCCLCGKKGHTGQLRDCLEDLPKVLTGEITGESNRSRNRPRHAEPMDVTVGGHRGGPSYDAYTGGARGQYGGGGGGGANSAGREERAYDQRPRHQHHGGQGNTQQAHEFGQRAPRVSAAVHGYGPNSRHGYREPGRGSAGAAQPASDWGSAQRSDWKRSGTGGWQAQQQGRTHGDGQQRMGAHGAAVMHPPPDQIGMHAAGQAQAQPRLLPRLQQPMQLAPGTVILQAPRMHSAPQQVQPQVVFAPLVHASPNAPPPDVQPIQRYNQSYDRPRMGAARREDDLGWRAQRGGAPHGGNDGSSRGMSNRSEHREPYDRRAEQTGRPRSHRRC